VVGLFEHLFVGDPPLFLQQGESKTTIETTIERSDLSDASLDKVCEPMLYLGEGGVGIGLTTLVDSSPLVKLENDKKGAGISSGKPHCMKVSQGFCEYIESDWLGGDWKYALHAQGPNHESGMNDKSCLTCADTHENCGVSSDQDPNSVDDYTKFFSFDLAADEPKFATSACGQNIQHLGGSPKLERPEGTNILSVKMPGMPDDNYQYNGCGIPRWCGWQNVPAGLLPTPPQAAQADCPLSWTAVPKRSSWLADCEKDREAICANIEANNAPFSCREIKHTSFEIAWGVAFATTQSIATVFLPLIVMVVVKKFGTPDDIAQTIAVKGIELQEKTMNPVV